MDCAKIIVRDSRYTKKRIHMMIDDDVNRLQ